MIVRVADIGTEGLTLRGPESFPCPFQDRSWRLLDVSLELGRDGDAVLVTGSLEAEVPQHCSRCLTPYAVVVAPAVEARFVPSGGARGAEHELGVDDLETDVYHRGEIDLNALLETETTLGLPMKPLCRADCRGLCPVCGGNRNTAACGCQERPRDSRWAPLRAWAERQSR